MAPIIGIDLGTTFTCVAVFKDGAPKIIFNDQGNYITPSCVSFTEDGVLIGDAAITHLPLNPENTVYDAKRLIGRQFNDPIVQEDMKTWPFLLIEGENGRPEIEITYEGEKRRLYPEMISSMILKRMKEIAEDYLEEEVKDAVVTVPAYFNDAQRRATKDAGTVAGLNVIRIINEPTAAAVAYGLNQDEDEKINVLVYDLGGGTFDVTILTIDSGVFEVKATSGNTHLGGQDFTNRIVNHCVEEIRNKKKIDITKNKSAMAYLRRSCDDAKKLLTFQKKANIILKHAEFDFSTSITRALFEEINKDLFESTLKYVQNALNDAKMVIRGIDRVVLVGGSTRIPHIQHILKTFVGGKHLNKSLNPDEGVALGAAIQAAIMSDENWEIVSNKVLVDVTPRSLGIEVKNWLMTNSTIIEKNTIIPTSCTKEYVTSCDFQPVVRFGVYEGENVNVEDNNFLDKFCLYDLPLRPKGGVKFDVTFDIDANGILKVTAVEKSNRTNTKTIEVHNVKEHLTSEQIDRMMDDVFVFMKDTNSSAGRSVIKSQIKKICHAIQNDNGLTGNKKKTLSRECNEVLRWILDNPNATTDEYEEKLNEIKTQYKR